MPKATAYDTVIIGGGPAGLSAAIFCGRLGLNTLVLEKTLTGGQPAVAISIEDYPGIASIDGWNLTQTMARQATDLHVKIHESEEVLAITDSPIKTITTTSGRYQARAVIITSGGTPKKLDVPGEDRLDRKGVHYCAQCAGPAYKNKPVAVVGNGILALTAASHLLGIAELVALITQKNSFHGDTVLLGTLQDQKNLRFLTGTQINAIVGAHSVTGIEIEKKANQEHSVMEVDGIFIYRGIIPETNFIDAQKNKDGFLQVDNQMQTSIRGIFAAGNAIRPETRVVIAAGEGAQAAHNVAAHLKLSTF